jgi:hypothetical protein
LARAVALAAAALIALAAVGCGEDEGVAAGATVNAYFGASLCAEAQGAAGKAGDLELRVICLEDPSPGGDLDLATAGASARRATEDSSAIAYVEARGPANRFARTIVEEAGIAFVTASSGESAVQRVLAAVEEAGSGSIRDEVRGNLESEQTP